MNKENLSKSESMQPMAVPLSLFTKDCNAIRTTIKNAAHDVKAAADYVKSAPREKGEDTGEMIANLMLCYRHLEDASMRLGKAIQAHDGGVGVYDKKTTVGA